MQQLKSDFYKNLKRDILQHVVMCCRQHLWGRPLGLLDKNHLGSGQQSYFQAEFSEIDCY